MVLQDTWLFQGSIYENVKYGKDDATMDDVINACKAAKIHSYITHLKDGYDTILTDGGVNISKGQKQLLTIARAYLLDSNMYHLLYCCVCKNTLECMILGILLLYNYYFE